jgi:large subunit ribosomal protein L25
MTIRSLEIQARENSGTGAARAVRRQGFIPAVVYGNNLAPVNVSIEGRLITKELKEPGILTRLYTINVDNKDQRVLIRDIQFHPVSDRPVHIDFMRISKDGKIAVDIAIHVINEEKSPGVREGGIVNLMHHTMHVTCSPEAIPASIDIDLTGLEMNGYIYLSDIKLPEGVSVLHAERYETLVTIAAFKEQKEEEIVEVPAEGEEAPAEGEESKEEGAEEEK